MLMSLICKSVGFQFWLEISNVFVSVQIEEIYLTFETCMLASTFI